MSQIRVVLNWLLGVLSGVSAFVGALLVGWNAVEVYYLSIGRVQPDFEQPPLGFVLVLLVIGIVLLVGGWSAGRWLKKDDLI